ncbi:MULTISPECIES: NADPH-dependent F420 reductase [unclassified Microbacterium]|uniref:NADPH-dependent F420 reductase n=1 Tax=unclassified Microbacterium TaxID=2609290 RepID=UPI00365848F4
MKIGVLGTGRVGRSIGQGLQAAGHEVVYGSRDPASSEPLGTAVVSLSEAVTDAEVVVSAIPGSVALDTLRAIGAPALAGRILMDIGNALAPDFTLIFPNASLGAAIQGEFPDTAVVKTLNTVTAPLMSNPGAIAPTSVFLSGDDASAKTTVAGLLTDLGWSDAARIDLGGIETARGPEHYIFLSMALMRTLGTTGYGIAVQRG